MSTYTYYIALGSNMGKRESYLAKAMEALNALSTDETIRCSRWYETKPWGKTDQADFLNGLCLLPSDLEPLVLLKELQRIEKELGRTRLVHWGPRSIDLDIIWIENEAKEALLINETALQVPHPYFWERRFVLVPLEELRPDFIWQNQTIQQRIAFLNLNEEG